MSQDKESSPKSLKRVDSAAKIALFYGFLPIEWPKITKGDIEVTREFEEEWYPMEKAAILREFYDLKGISGSQPLMFFLEKKGRKTDKIECELVILGSQKSISEVILIQTARAILDNAGFREISIRINSVGNKDNMAEFERKTGAFIRKRIADFPAELRQNIKKDIFCLIKSKEEKYNEWRESAPQSVDYLSEASRLHLKEILEFIEAAGLSYIMDSSLIGDIRYSTETVFEIVSETSEEVLARGFRWNRLSKKIDNKKEVPAVSLSINIKALKAQKFTIIKKPEPKFYLVQFGPEAKQKSFFVLEKLRKVGVSVSHSLAKDKLASQISLAEQGGMPYIILIGQKEAIDNVVVIRNTATRAQYTVPIEELPEFIKKSTEFK